MKKEKALAIVSGGMDSVTMLHHIVHSYEIPLVLSFNYGSKHNFKEIPQAKWQCNYLKILHKEIDLQFLGRDLQKTSALLNPSMSIPEGHYSDDKMKVTVVPNRNMVMLAIAVAYAEDQQISNVLIGSHLGDRAQYPDCREEFTQAISLASMLGTYSKVKVVSPFNLLLKREILEIGLKLGIDYSHTHTCYNGDPQICMGRCSTCIERIEAFMQCKVKDPIYTDTQWKQVVEKCERVLSEYEHNK